MSKERVEQLLRDRARREERELSEVVQEFRGVMEDLREATATARSWNDRVDQLGREYAFRRDPASNPRPELEPLSPRELRDGYWAAKSARAQANRGVYCLDRKLNVFLGEDLFRNGRLISEGGELDG